MRSSLFIQIVFYPAPVPATRPVPAYQEYRPVVIDAHKRTRRSVYASYDPAPVAYTPSWALKHSSISLESTYVPVSYTEIPEEYALAPAPYTYVKPVPKPTKPVEYVQKPSYEPRFSYPRSHIPIQEETNDIPEDKPKPGPASATPTGRLFVPVSTTTAAPTTTTAAPTTTPPAFQTYASLAPSDNSPPAPSPVHSSYRPPVPTQASTPVPTPAPTLVAEVYTKPVVSQYSPLPLGGYEHNPYLRYVPTPAAESPPPTTTPPPPPSTPVPSTPGYVETYFIPKDPAPLPFISVKSAAIPVLPVPVPAGPLPAMIATPIRSQFHSQDELGQYTFGYANELSSKTEIKTADGITQGHYSYIDANGHVQSVHYVSDDHHGFRVAATNLPEGPVLEYKK